MAEPIQNEISRSRALDHPRVDIQQEERFTSFPEPEEAEDSITARFARTLSVNASRLAFSGRDGLKTYADLNERSNRIANVVLSRTQPVSEGICIYLGQLDDVPSAMLAVLKCGKFFVALDPEDPKERNQSLFEHSRASLILVSNDTFRAASSFVADKHRVINIDKLPDDASSSDPKVHVRPGSIASVVYKSGKSGSPHGVMISHQCVLHRLSRQSEGWGMRQEDRVALLFPQNAASAIDTVFGALTNGASIFSYKLALTDADDVLKKLETDQISYMQLAPHDLRQLMTQMIDAPSLQALRLVRVIGDSVYSTDIERFQKLFAEACELHVGFGCTETGDILNSVFNKSSKCRFGVVALDQLDKGLRIEIRNESGEPTKDGEIGELVVKGEYLFSGYWGYSKRETQVLFPDENSTSESVFYTGDLASRLPNGQLEWVGRTDSQIKIRGFRVEISEVEHALLGTPGISLAAVVVNETELGCRELVAFLVPEKNVGIDEEFIRKQLETVLPEVMIPNLFLQVDTLPLGSTAGAA